MKYLKDHILYDKILEYTHSSSVTMSSSDVGDVSNVIPTSQIIVACYAIGTSVHSWQEVAQGKASYAFKGMLKASDVLANAANKFLEKPELIEEAWEELIKRRGPKFVSPIPDGRIPMVLRKDKY
ncbi:hypothetical protein [Peptoniphilus raoultii]|uniref:hypothetical protein n=1 Tax=Peptoniphilus raoultii TaxID=1776387 RepID=UPI001FD6B4E2|nr:hypothetical protein [Peptoniphilus raoultii]